MKETTKCNSCNVEISARGKSTIFPCPECGEEEIVRCDVCRKRVISYKCSKCGFEGP